MIKKTDANHKEIMNAFRQIPYLSVFSTHMVGKGFPDIVVGYRGINLLVEIKDGKKSPSQRKLTKDEMVFHRQWNGQVIVITCVEDIYKLLKILS